ncbi:MAG: malto-oligosyltrehalose trehalohydrolase [Opitutaceae bacterium]
MKRKFPIGAEVQPGGGVHFRVWAPNSRGVAVELHSAGGQVLSTVEMNREEGDYFSRLIEHARAGDLYKFRLDGGSYADPASRFQPQGPHGPSEVIATDRFQWSDQAWRGLNPREVVIYEMHMGTFTREGTWSAAREQLPELQRIGITVIEVMPIAEFPGEFGWGYDGVDLFAPCHVYGSPDDARAFINRAHELGVMVILDVVYNHLGPDGNYVGQFSPDYFSALHQCEWGQAMNFDGQNCGPVREFFLTNARYWIEEFHFDGFRLDATQQIHDDSTPHVIAEISRVAREAGEGRTLFIVAENEPQDARLMRSPDEGGYGLDSMWNDDFHHSAIVAGTGKSEAYYSDYRGKPQEFISALKHGFLSQGQWYHWQKQRRGRPALDVEARRLVVFLQNHDQIANSLRGARLHQLASPGHLRALTALTLLSPCTPMLFQGQEFGASAPFLYFADHPSELRKLVATGRKNFLSQFSSMAVEGSQAILPEPHDVATFARCKLDFTERTKNAAVYQMHADLLRLRREDKTILHAVAIDGAVLDEHAFVLRFFSAAGEDRLLLVNFGSDLRLAPAPEPLLAPPEGRGWSVSWSSEAPEYGGGGTPPIETTAGWQLPGRSAILLRPANVNPLPDAKLSEKN